MTTYGLGGYISTKDFVKKKAVRVLLPYLVWAVFLIGLQGRSWFAILQGVSPLWYLLFIFEAYVSFRLIDKYFNEKSAKWFLLFSVILLLVAGKISLFVPYRLFVGYQYLRYMPYYIIGCCIHRIGNVNNYKPLIGFLISLIIFTIVFSVTKRYIFLIIPGAALSVSIFLLAWSSKIASLHPLIQSLDKCSMGIYLIHHIIIQEANVSSYIRPMMSEHVFLYPIILFLTVFPASWLLTYWGKRTVVGNFVLG